MGSGIVVLCLYWNLKKAYIVHKATVHYRCSVVANFIQMSCFYTHIFSEIYACQKYICIYYDILCIIMSVLLYIIYVCVRNWYTSEMYACQKYIYVRNISMSEINACQKHVHVRNICM